MNIVFTAKIHRYSRLRGNDSLDQNIFKVNEP
jgi:hypothetical protein